MDDLRERFRTLDHSLADLDMPDLLTAAELRATVTTERRPRYPSRLVVLLAALALGGVAIGWAYFASTARDTVSIQCEIAGVSTVISSASGDPVADCAGQWRRDTGDRAPRLAAYDNGHGGITVLPADEAPPSGWTRLPDGATQNVSMVQLQQWLDDYVSGLNSGCYDNPTAVQMTAGELRRLGMANWTVRPAPPDEASSCVNTGILDPRSSTVVLRGLGGPAPADVPAVRLAVKLRSIAATCQPLGPAAVDVRSAAAELGLSEDARGYQLDEVQDDALRCTTIAEDVGGTINIILRGPST